MEKLSAGLLWELIKHARSWLANLDRASAERKAKSIEALRGVIRASRETAVYLRHLKQSDQRSHDTELRIAMLWTELGFSLKDLGITKLAKRCQIKGRHWANPGHYDKDFLSKADISLDTMERLANEILGQVSR